METKAKSKEIISPLLQAGPDHEGGNRIKSKTTVVPSFSTLGQESVFDSNDDQDYIMIFISKFLSVS